MAVSSIELKLTLVPSAASAGVKYKLVYISVPISLNFLSSCIFIFINKSPFFPPFFPALPCPK